MSDTDLIAEVRARAEAATPGPWFNPDRLNPPGTSLVMKPINPASIYAQIPELTNGRDVLCAVSSQNHNGDAEFIAHAREDIPFLLAEVSALREVIEKALDFPEDDWRYDGGTLGSRMRKILRSVPAVASPETKGDN